MSHGVLKLGGPSLYAITPLASRTRLSSSQCRTSGSTSGSTHELVLPHGWQRRKLVVCSSTSEISDAGGGLFYRRSLTAAAPAGRQQFSSDGFGTEEKLLLRLSRRKVGIRVVCKMQAGAGGRNSTVEDWTKKLPAKRKALYSHSLPCIEAWLQSLGFIQGKEDRAIWNIERPDWHAQISLDITDLHVRYLRKGPGNLERDVERKFSYALSREDLENAILGGP